MLGNFRLKLITQSESELEEDELESDERDRRRDFLDFFVFLGFLVLAFLDFFFMARSSFSSCSILAL